MTQYRKHDEMQNIRRGPLISFNTQDGLPFGEMYIPSQRNHVEYQRGMQLGHPLGARSKQITGPMDIRHHNGVVYKNTGGEEECQDNEDPRAEQ